MSTDTLATIHIYLPFAKLIHLTCCTARQLSGYHKHWLSRRPERRFSIPIL